jgi:hypothetical protein
MRPATTVLRRRSVPRIEVLLVPVAAALLAVLLTWPLLPGLDDHAHNPFDPLYQAWTLDWVQHAIGTGAPLWDANAFAGHPRSLAFGEALLGAAVVLLPFRWLGLSPIGVLNVGLLLGYASSGVAGYVFGRVVSGRVVVAACTGVVFAFGSYNAFLGQHMSIVVHAGPALAAAAVWRLADRCRDGSRMAPSLAVLTAVIALQGSISFYTGALSVAAAGIVLLVRVRALRARGVAAASAAVALAIALLLPIALPYLRHASAFGDAYRWRLGDLATAGADFLSVDPSSTVWGSTLAAPTGIFSQPTFPGVAVLLLALVGLLAWEREVDRRVRSLAVALAVIAAVLAIGTSDEGWRRYAPYRLVYEHVPGGAALRATGRFWLVGLLGVGLLVGVGVARVASTTRGRERGRAWAGGTVAALCLAAILVEGHRSWDDLAPVGVRPADRALSELPDPGGVVHLPLPTSPAEPFDLLGQAQVLYGSTAHHRPLLNGYASFYPPDFFSSGAPLVDLPSHRSLDHLRGLGVRFVVVPVDAGPWSPLRDPARALPMRLVGDFDGDLLYEVPAAGGAQGAGSS